MAKLHAEIRAVMSREISVTTRQSLIASPLCILVAFAERKSGLKRTTGTKDLVVIAAFPPHN